VSCGETGDVFSASRECDHDDGMTLDVERVGHAEHPSIRAFRSIVFRQSRVRDGDVTSQLRLRMEVACVRLSDSMSVGTPIGFAATEPRYFTSNSMRVDLDSTASAS
jgi:hypothetical protein